MSLFAAIALLAYSGLPTDDLAPEAPDPSMVVGGQAAPTCGWPSTVQLATNSNEPFCTASLLDSRTVITAAHCVDQSVSPGSPDKVVFGESHFAPQETIQISSCATHPQWNQGNGLPGQSFFYDLAVCTLSANAPDVPIVPPLMGCEADILVPGQTMTIVGFGADNEAQGSGAGIKRFTTQTIESVNLGTNDLTLLGAGGSSACFGDSGGPVFVQLPDGSWRVAGVTSTAHPDVWYDPQQCGYGVVDDMIHTQMEWFEAQTGRDLTPCHDADGTWNPDERCDALPVHLTPPGVSWGAECHGGAVSGLGSSCGAPFEDGLPPDPGGGDSGGEPPPDQPPPPDPSGGDDGDGGGDDDSGEDTDDFDTDGDTDDFDTDGETDGLGDTDTDDMDDPIGVTGIPGWPQQQRDPAGCTCRSAATPTGRIPWALLAFGFGLARRRRTRSIR